MELFDVATAELIRSNADRKHPFKYCWLATFGTFPEVRTVVKRSIDRDLNILIYTDARSRKVDQIRMNALCSLLFYHARKKLQLRLRGRMHILDHNDALYKEHLQRVKSQASTADYSTELPPGTVVSSDEINYSEEFHFDVLKFVTHELEVLQLDKSGHDRRLYRRADAGWVEQILVP